VLHLSCRFSGLDVCVGGFCFFHISILGVGVGNPWVCVGLEEARFGRDGLRCKMDRHVGRETSMMVTQTQPVRQTREPAARPAVSQLSPKHHALRHQSGTAGRRLSRHHRCSTGSDGASRPLPAARRAFCCCHVCVPVLSGIRECGCRSAACEEEPSRILRTPPPPNRPTPQVACARAAARPPCRSVLGNRDMEGTRVSEPRNARDRHTTLSSIGWSIDGRSKSKAEGVKQRRWLTS